MATNIRGRSGSHSRTTYGNYNRQTTGTSHGNWGQMTKTGGRTTRTKATTTNVPAGYKNVADNFTWKINSYRTLFNQTKGAAKYTRPTPTTLNTFANWINKGANIHTVTPAQIARWARTTNKTFNTRNPTTTACKNVLWAKFGKNMIKAVARTKSGSYMVATPQTWKGKWFNFPR